MRKQLAPIFLSAIAFYLAPIALIEPPGPVISDLTVSPLSGPTGTVYRISLRIASRSGVVPLLRQVREGRETISVPLRDDGREGDVSKGDGIYTGHSGVPPTAARQTHHFEVYIEDEGGRKSNPLEYLFTVLEGEAI